MSPEVSGEPFVLTMLGHTHTLHAAYIAAHSGDTGL
jgi:hypothetical protein